MFDKQAYREACGQLKLDAEKLEEMIAMTENTNAKKRLSRPVKTVLIAAACVAALCITAFATPAVQKMLFTSYTLTTADGDNIKVSVAPEIRTYSEDGRSYLVVDDETFDITEALEKDGFFQIQTEDGHEIRVDKDGWVTVTGEDVNYTFNSAQSDADGVIDVGGLTVDFTVDGERLTENEVGTYEVTIDDADGMTVVRSYTTDGEGLTPSEVGTYEITTDENGKGEMIVLDYTPASGSEVQEVKDGWGSINGGDVSYTFNSAQTGTEGLSKVEFHVDSASSTGVETGTYHITTIDENGEVGGFTVDGEALTGGDISYSFHSAQTDADGLIEVSSFTVDGEALTESEVGTYYITTDANGEMIVSDYTPAN